MSLFANISHFYKNFAELYSAGIDSASTLESLGSRADNNARPALNLAAQNLRNGRTLYQSLKLSQLVPAIDLPIVKAAEDSGRLAEIFKSLAQKYANADRALRQIRMSLIKPLLTFAVALIFPGVMNLFTGKVSLFVFLRNSVGTLVLVGFVVYFVYDYWIQSLFNVQKSRSLYGILSNVPFCKGLCDRISLEKFSTTLAFMLESNLDFFESLNQSARCAFNPKIQSAVEQIVVKVQSGVELSKAFETENTFPLDFISAVSLGSRAGKLPEFLNRYSLSLKIQNENTIKNVVRFTPIILYWIVIGQIAYTVVTFYSSYLDTALKMAP